MPDIEEHTRASDMVYIMFLESFTVCLYLFSSGRGLIIEKKKRFFHKIRGNM